MTGSTSYTSTSDEVLPKELTQVNFRRGKWTIEEENYTSRIIKDFENGESNAVLFLACNPCTTSNFDPICSLLLNFCNLSVFSGTLDVPDGTTLRTHLSSILNCDPMRITKKFTGDSCIGKRVFQPLSRFVLNCDASNSTSTSADVVNKEIVGNSHSTGTGSDSKYPAVDGDKSRKYLDELNVSNEANAHAEQNNQNNPKITADNNNSNSGSSSSSSSNSHSGAINYANCALIDNSRKELKTLRRIWLEKMLSAEREQARKNCVKSSSSIKHNSGRNKVPFFISILSLVFFFIYLICVGSFSFKLRT
jgi:hypothetical protein